MSWSGSLAGETNDALTLGARLTEATTSNPIPGQTLTFSFGGQNFTATTDANGTASVATSASMPPGAVLTTVGYAASGPHSGTSMTQYLNIVRDESSIAITSNPNVAEGTSQIVTALLTDPDGGAPLTNRAVTFTIGAVTATVTR